jgi:hypothetical protein
VTAPAVLIRFELEAAPRLFVESLNDREHDRLIDWVEAHPDYLDLIRRALALETQERAA